MKPDRFEILCYLSTIAVVGLVTTAIAMEPDGPEIVLNASITSDGAVSVPPPGSARLARPVSREAGGKLAAFDLCWASRQHTQIPAFTSSLPLSERGLGCPIE